MACSIDSWAFLSADDVRQYLGLQLSDLQENAFHVYHDQSGAPSAATVEVTATHLVLVETGGASPSSNSLQLNAYATMTALKAAVDALAQGWVFLLDAPADAPPTTLVITAQQSCLGSANVAYVQFYDYCNIYGLINQTCAAVETLCKRKFYVRTFTERYMTDRTGRVRLRNYPVQHIDWVGIGRQNAFSVINTGTNISKAEVKVATNPTVTNANQEGTARYMRFMRHPSSGWSEDVINLLDLSVVLDDVIDTINALGNSWAAALAAPNIKDLYDVPSMLPNQSYPCWNKHAYIQMPGPRADMKVVNWEAGIIDVGIGSQEVYVKYDAGYDTIPYDLQLVTLQMLAGLYQSQSSSTTDMTLNSERLGDYSYTRESGSVTSNSAVQANSLATSEVMAALGPWISDGWSDY